MSAGIGCVTLPVAAHSAAACEGHLEGLFGRRRDVVTQGGDEHTAVAELGGPKHRLIDARSRHRLLVAGVGSLLVIARVIVIGGG